MPANDHLEHDFLAQLDGQEVIVHLLATTPGRAILRGMLREWSQRMLTLETDEAVRLIPYHAITLIEPKGKRPVRFD